MIPARAHFDGLLNFHKPTGPTSAKALYRVRTLTGIRKSGHAGTLDPAASGVLLLCMGRATKLVESLMDLPKLYHASGRLDVTSKSLDSDSPWQPVQVDKLPGRDAIFQAAESMVGRIDQIPPAVSALKVGGVPAYKLAGTAREPRLAARKITVYRMTVTRFDWPEIDFEVRCGRGTYIRSIIRDLGQKVGAGGCLTGLQRAAVGPFRISEAVTFEDLERGQFENRRYAIEQLQELLATYREAGMPEEFTPAEG